jgi:hypothetical protein
MAMDERVWLTHPASGNHFLCPAEAVEDWTHSDMGWVVADGPPDEYNPVTAEALAQSRALAEQAAEEEARATTKSSRKSGTDTTPQEG